MPFPFSLTIDDRISPPNRELTNIGGEDISLDGGDMSENASRDIATVSGVACARQSIIRELPANPGSLPRRPQWGGGLSGMLLKNNTEANRDRAVSRSRDRLQANPRVTKINEISATAESTGIRINIRADVVGGPLSTTFVVKPPGV